MEIILATRGSELAMAQTRIVMMKLREAWEGVNVRELVIRTKGDRNAESPLVEIGGMGVFTKEVEQAVKEGSARGAVHSLKDLPVELTEELVFGAILERGNPADVLVSARRGGVGGLSVGAKVGTGSPRRERMLAVERGDLEIKGIRGNVPKRLGKVASGEYDAVILAAAGLERLGMSSDGMIQIDGEELYASELPTFLPAPGQAAIAVEVLRSDSEMREIFRKIHHEASAIEVIAERSVLAALGGGCHLPLGARAKADRGTLHIEAVLFEGKNIHRAEVEGRYDMAKELGILVAKKLYEN